MPRFRPASLPFASNVSNVGSRPVRMLEFFGPLLFSAVNTQNTFTFPENVNAQPLDICIVRPCALAVALTPNARPNNNSVRRFIRESLLGSLPAQSCRSCLRGTAATGRRQVSPSGNVVLPPVMLVWLLTYACVTERKAESTSSRERVDRAAHRRRAFRTKPNRRPLGTPRSSGLGPARRSGRQGRRPKRFRNREANPHAGRPMAWNPAKY